MGDAGLPAVKAMLCSASSPYGAAEPTGGTSGRIGVTRLSCCAGEFGEEEADARRASVEVGVVPGLLAPFRARFPAQAAVPLFGSRTQCVPDFARKTHRIGRTHIDWSRAFSLRCGLANADA